MQGYEVSAGSLDDGRSTAGLTVLVTCPVCGNARPTSVRGNLSEKWESYRCFSCGERFEVRFQAWFRTD